MSLADSDLGQVLVGPDGNTVYSFEKDTSGDASTCSGECASDCPPLTTKGKPTAGSGVDASMLTTFKRDDGTTQIAFNGHPLYYFSGDSAPGDTNGNESDAFGGEWYAMNASSDDDSSTSTLELRRQRLLVLRLSASASGPAACGAGARQLLDRPRVGVAGLMRGQVLLQVRARRHQRVDEVEDALWNSCSKTIELPGGGRTARMRSRSPRSSRARRSSQS